MSRYVGPERRREARRRAVTKLRDLADRIEAKDLPEKGAVVELAREVEKVLDDERPVRKPGERSAQAKRLAKVLRDRTGADVGLRYEPTKNRSSGKPGYRVHWSNGPTYDRMRAHVAHVMSSGRFDLLDIGKYDYARDGGGWCELAALFRHLESNPVDDLAEHIRVHTYTEFGGGSYVRLEDFARRLWDDAEHPERLVDQWRPQLEALAELERRQRVDRQQGTSRRFRDGYDLLAEKLRTCSWRETRDWLGAIAAGLKNPDAAQFDVRRTGQSRT